MNAFVVSLCRYPVKSMLGEELTGAPIGERGLLGDREYAIPDVETGKVASAKSPRTTPIHALVQGDGFVRRGDRVSVT